METHHYTRQEAADEFLVVHFMSHTEPALVVKRGTDRFIFTGLKSWDFDVLMAFTSAKLSHSVDLYYIDEELATNDWSDSPTNPSGYPVQKIELDVASVAEWFQDMTNPRVMLSFLYDTTDSRKAWQRLVFSALLQTSPVWMVVCAPKHEMLVCLTYTALEHQLMQYAQNGTRLEHLEVTCVSRNDGALAHEPVTLHEQRTFIAPMPGTS